MRPVCHTPPVGEPGVALLCHPQPPAVPQPSSSCPFTGSRSSPSVKLHVPLVTQVPAAGGAVQSASTLHSREGSPEQRKQPSEIGIPCVHGRVVSPLQKPSNLPLKF